MKKNIIICLGCIILLLLPFGGAIIAKLGFQKRILDNPDFWYSFMTYFGTVVLSAVALFQNVNADEVNKRLMKQELRQKIGYFELKKVDEQNILLNSVHEIRLMKGYEILKIEKRYDTLGRSDNSSEPVVKICLRNVGEDVILNLNILQIKINGKEVMMPCSNSVVYKNEEIWFEIEYAQTNNVDNLEIEMLLSLENIAGILYQQSISIGAKKFQSNEDGRVAQVKEEQSQKEKLLDIFVVTKFGSSIRFIK